VDVALSRPRFCWQHADFLLNASRSKWAAKRFFRKVLGGMHVTTPRVINVDKNPTYIGVVRDLRREKLLPQKCKRRASRYMNNIIEQDHRFMKQPIGPGLGFFSYPTAWLSLSRIYYEATRIEGKVSETDLQPLSSFAMVLKRPSELGRTAVLK
jgi:transposase-like protein